MTAPFDSWTSSGKEVFDFWISFFPTAPLFGVGWRFAGALPPLTGVTMPDETLFPTIFPGVRACAAARPGEVASPAGADDAAPDDDAGSAAKPVTTAAKPAEKTANAAGAAAEQASMLFATAANPHDVTPATDDTQPAHESAEARSDTPDDLKIMKGIGPGLERQLNELGIRKFSQIAKMSEDELARLDEQLTTVKGRCFRDDWIGQARQLAQ